MNLLVRQPNQFLEDLRRLNQLKDSPYHDGLDEKSADKCKFEKRKLKL